MKLPNIGKFYTIVQNNNSNESMKNIKSLIISQNKVNEYNRPISSNHIFFKKCHSTNDAPKILHTIKFSSQITNEIFDTDESTNKKINNKKYNNAMLKNMNSYRKILLPEDNLRLNNLHLKFKKKYFDKMNKNINLVKSSDNLFLQKNSNNSDINISSEKIKKFIDKSIIVKPNDSNKKIKNENDEDKTVLPFSTNILKYNHSIENHKYIENEIRKDSSKKKIIQSKLDNKKYHEHYISFNNSFMKKNSWNNHVLKSLLPKNINYILNEEQLKKIARNNAQSNQEKEIIEKKRLKNKQFNLFKNYRDYYCNSFFNCEINDFCNNYKSYNNNNNQIFINNKKMINNKLNFGKLQKNAVYIHETPKNNEQNKKNNYSNVSKNYTFDLINLNSLYQMKNFN